MGDGASTWWPGKDRVASLRSDKKNKRIPGHWIPKQRPAVLRLLPATPRGENCAPSRPKHTSRHHRQDFHLVCTASGAIRCYSTCMRGIRAPLRALTSYRTLSAV